jgi:hypothetical protein
MGGMGIIHRIHRLAWFATTLSTGLLAGFLASHSVMLGRFFTWLIESGNVHVLTDAFAAFRLSTGANVRYDAFFWAALLIGAFWALLSFVVRKDRTVAVVGGLSSFWAGCVFFATGFSNAEKAVVTGVADEATRQFFVSWNVPLHASLAVFFALCFLLLLVTGCRGKRPSTPA